MPKLTPSQYNDVVQLMEEVLVSFEQDIQDAKGTEFEDLIPMYQDDRSYGMRCLEIFKDCRDLYRLIENLRDQDTAPRELYYKVFDYYYSVKEKGDVLI